MNTSTSNTPYRNGAAGNDANASMPAPTAATGREEENPSKAAPTRTGETVDGSDSKARDRDGDIRQDDQAGTLGTQAPSSN